MSHLQRNVRTLKVTILWILTVKEYLGLDRCQLAPFVHEQNNYCDINTHKMICFIFASCSPISQIRARRDHSRQSQHYRFARAQEASSSSQSQESCITNSEAVKRATRVSAAPGAFSIGIGDAIRYSFTSPSGEISVKDTISGVLRLCGVPLGTISLSP